jgi:hypothetical protein
MVADEFECCPKFNPAPWDEKILEWSGKKFVKDRVFTLFFMPINFGAVITRLMKKIEQSGAKVQDNLSYPIIPQSGIWICIWR